MNKLSPEEKKEIIQKLREKFNHEDVESLGYDRYVITKKTYTDVPGFGPTWLSKDKMADEAGNLVPLSNEYDNIFGFARGVAVVCRRDLPQKTENGAGFTRGRKDGLIDTNGNELLPCIYDSIHVHLDGFVEITKDGVKKATSVTAITNGEFYWEEAPIWNS